VEKVEPSDEIAYKMFNCAVLSLADTSAKVDLLKANQ
jgi:hypothetical protein